MTQRERFVLDMLRTGKGDHAEFVCLRRKEHTTLLIARAGGKPVFCEACGGWHVTMDGTLDSLKETPARLDAPRSTTMPTSTPHRAPKITKRE